MAILEATLTGDYSGNLCINRFHYITTGDPGPVTPSFALMSAMGFLPPSGPSYLFAEGTLARVTQVLAAQGYKFKAFYVKNLYTPTDFVETAYNPATSGGMTGTPASPILAYGFQSNRTRTDIRRGSKRFAGVTEECMGSAGVIAGDAVGYSNTMATALGAVLSYTAGGAGLTLTPAVLGFEEYETPAGNRAYRKYSSEAAQLTHAATGITYSPMPYVRSQVSRQFGRGA